MKSRKRRNFHNSCLKRVLAILGIAGLFISIIFSVTTYAYNIEKAPRVILLDKNTVQYDISFGELPKVNNNKIYLYELEPFEYDIAEDASPLLSGDLSEHIILRFDFDNEMLYKKFALAGYIDGRLTMLCSPSYIVNPEVLATSSKPRRDRKEFCTQTVGLANIPLNGKGGYYMSTDTMQVLNSRSNRDITHPLARNGVEDNNPVEHYYYMFNAADKAGIDAITKELKWYAKNTRAQDFIIGNEVNNRIWNYMSYIPWEDYVREYTNLYRVCYNAIKSTNRNARVYISLEGDWDRDRELDHWEYHTYIDSKDFLDKFNRKILAEGNINWGLSIHPYIVPVDYAKFWDYSEHPDGEYMTKMIDTKAMYCFQNMTFVTDYMLDERFRNQCNRVRDIIISEIGVDRKQGDDVQAAAICASYVAFKRNPYITQYMYTDTAGYGVDLTMHGRTRDAFDAMGTKNEQEYLDWALSYIGADSWDDVMDLYPEDYIPEK